jgi:hypothetical protein
MAAAWIKAALKATQSAFQIPFTDFQSVVFGAGGAFSAGPPLGVLQLNLEVHCDAM